MKIFILIFLLSTNSFAAYKFEKGELSGLAIGKPSLMKIKITGPGPTGTLTEKDGTLSGTLNLNLAELKTGIDLRDRHMKEKYLEITKYPDATLEVTGLTPSTNADSAFQGMLTVKGQSKPVSGTYNLADNQLTAEFKFSIKDYPIATPKYLGIEVTDVVEIKVSSKVVKE